MTELYRLKTGRTTAFPVKRFYIEKVILLFPFTYLFECILSKLYMLSYIYKYLYYIAFQLSSFYS